MSPIWALKDGQTTANGFSIQDLKHHYSFIAIFDQHGENAIQNMQIKPKLKNVTDFSFYV